MKKVSILFGFVMMSALATAQQNDRLERWVATLKKYSVSSEALRTAIEANPAAVERPEAEEALAAYERSVLAMDELATIIRRSRVMAAQPVASEPGIKMAKTNLSAGPQIIGKWTGNGMKQTESFVAPKRECAIAWSVKDTSGFGAVILQIYVHEDGSDRLVNLAANSTAEGSDSSVLRLEPGKRYYLQISSNARWAVSVTTK